MFVDPDYSRYHGLVCRLGKLGTLFGRSTYPGHVFRGDKVMSTTSRFSAAVTVLVAASVLGMGGVAQAALVLWLDSSDGATVRNTSNNPASNGDPVATWLDKAAPSQDAVAQTGNPIYQTGGGPNGNAVIDLSSMPVANLVTNAAVQARTIILVHRWDTTSSGTSPYFFDLRDGIPNSYVWQGDFGPNWTVYAGTSTTPTSSVGAVRNNTWQTTAFVGTSTGSDLMHIFSRYTNNEFGLGKVAEIRVYDTVLTEVDRLAAVSELYQKWFPKQYLVPINSATTTSTPSTNTPTALISDANGNYYYLAPNPGSGGGGTSWHTTDPGSSNVNVVFNFQHVDSVDALLLWDYYTHSPSNWRLELFSGTGATGTTLLSYDFSISPGPSGSSTRNVIDVPNTFGVLSARLTSLNNSQSGGVGLAEVAFAEVVPEPSTFLLAVLGVLGLAVWSGRGDKRGRRSIAL
jgi:hypothetical protein